MRKNIVHPGSSELKYEIRDIVSTAKKFEKLGQKMIWENIGDPLHKGEDLPQWMKDIVQKEAQNDESYGYCPTKGVLKTREYIVKERKKEGVKLDVEDILFFNGLGDAISTTYFYVNRHARIIGPDPAYPTHSSAESARNSETEHITYPLLPEKKWEPDFKELENHIKFNENIAGILIINPGNPTGANFSKKVLKKFIDLAEKYDLFIIADEVYGKLAHQKNKFTPIYTLSKKVPMIVMKGLSKEIPWPGSRCGWIEFHNRKVDENFYKFSESIMHAKMLEVCSTTLPQKVLPAIFKNKNFNEWLNDRIEKYKKRADFAYKIFSKNKFLVDQKPNGAFYYPVVFKDGVLNQKQNLKIENSKVKKELEKILKGGGISNDKRFVYYLMAKTGIVVVPLSGFNSRLDGFRLTLLEEDGNKFQEIIKNIDEAIKEYLKK